MSGTSLVLLAMYSTLNVLAPHHPFAPSSAPWLIAFLMAAACLTLLATLSLHSLPERRTPERRPVHRRFSGPSARRH